MRIKRKRREVLRPQRHVAQDGDREGRLRFGKRAEVRLFLPPRFNPRAARADEYKRRKTAGSSNCRSARLFLSVSAMTGAGILPMRRLSSANT